MSTQVLDRRFLSQDTLGGPPWFQWSRAMNCFQVFLKCGIVSPKVRNLVTLHRLTGRDRASVGGLRRGPYAAVQRYAAVPIDGAFLRDLHDDVIVHRQPGFHRHGCEIQPRASEARRSSLSAPVPTAWKTDLMKTGAVR
jgi:hypothetical protein